MAGRSLEEDNLGKVYDLGLMKGLLDYARPYWGQFALAAALLCAVTLLEQAGPYLTKIMIDQHIVKNDLAGILPLSSIYLASVLGVFLLQTWQTIQTAHTGQAIMLDLRRKLFTHIHAQPLSFFDKNPVGRLMTRVIYDVENINDFFTQGVVAIFNDFFTLLAVSIALLSMNWRLGLVAISLLPLLVWSTLLFRKFFRENFRQVRSYLAKINSFLAENLSGMTTVQAFVREQKNSEKFDGLNATIRELGLKQIRLNAFFLPVAEAIAALSVALVLCYGGWQVKNQALTLGVVVAGVQYVTRFFQPLRDLADKYNILQNTMASFERLFALLNRQAEIKDPANPILLPRLQGEIEFEKVWFAYLENEWVLRDISFRVKPGEKIAVVGPTGAGKTSLVSVLMRFYPYQMGAVRLDGKRLEDLNRADFRRQVGLVLQEQFLFSGSVLENVRLSDPTISRELVIQACQQVAAEEFISKLPKGYDSEIGERGSSLSAGQRQLLAFARALVFDPRILILDEATAQVDPFTEQKVQDALTALLKGRTSITIAHRLATVVNADRILVIQDGRLVEEGNHSELMQRNGLYRTLVELQFQEIG